VAVSFDPIAIAAKQDLLKTFGDVSLILAILFGDINSQISRLETDISLGITNDNFDLIDRLTVIRNNVNVSTSFVSNRLLKLRTQTFGIVDDLVISTAAKDADTLANLIATISGLISNSIGFLKTDLFNAIGIANDTLSAQIGNLRFLFDETKTFISQGLDKVTTALKDSILPALGVLKADLIDVITAGPKALLDLIVSLFFEDVPDVP